MAKKSYGISNISYRDEERVDDFLLIRSESSKSTFSFPSNINSYGYMFPSPEVEFYSTGSEDQRDHERYTNQEIDNLVQDLRLDMSEFARQLTGQLNDTVNENLANGVTLITSENIVELDTESEG